jgi:hypothetical protein
MRLHPPRSQRGATIPRRPTMTKRSALKLARYLRSIGKRVRVFCHKGIVCEPGRGVTPYCFFTVDVVG